MAWHTIAKIGEFESESMKVVIIENRPIILSKLDGKFYAIDAICTHMPGYLPDGKVEEDCITCPLHHAQYDLKTGRMTKNVHGLYKVAIGGARDLNSYGLRIEGDEIKLEK
jgi:3-phenylpropionate/trans-cinnamate dioxygenase ferredoxin subunit